MKILFLHGWHSVPGGLKPSYLAQHGYEVINPALDDEDFDEAVRIAQVEYDRHQPDVIVGSSRGGAVAMNIDIGAKWYRNYFYFFSTYACPGPNALSPTFESKFARMEYLGNATFALYFMRHTGEWVGLYDALSVDESLKAIREDPWFMP